MGRTGRLLVGANHVLGPFLHELVLVGPAESDLESVVLRTGVRHPVDLLRPEACGLGCELDDDRRVLPLGEVGQVAEGLRQVKRWQRVLSVAVLRPVRELDVLDPLGIDALGRVALRRELRAGAAHGEEEANANEKSDLSQCNLH